VTSEFGPYRDNCQVHQAGLAEVGIEMNVQVFDHSTIRQGTNEIVWYTAPRPTVDQLLFHFLHGDSIVVEGENPITNFSYYDGIDDLIEKAQSEIDVERQEELWIQANLEAMEDAIIMPSAHPVFAYAHTDDFDPRVRAEGLHAQRSGDDQREHRFPQLITMPLPSRSSGGGLSLHGYTCRPSGGV
jgi:ABC-type transport system substrate-binding protein